MSGNSDWPDGADGDVLRRLADDGLDFSKPYEIDFNIDFEHWPPQSEAFERVRARYPAASLIAPDDGFGGYILVCVSALLTYDLVMEVQRDLTQLTAPFGGVCESWGVLHDGAKNQ